MDQIPSKWEFKLSKNEKIKTRVKAEGWSNIIIFELMLNLQYYKSLSMFNCWTWLMIKSYWTWAMIKSQQISHKSVIIALTRITKNYRHYRNEIMYLSSCFVEIFNNSRIQISSLARFVPGEINWLN